jgi:hypothetical protein
MEEWRLFGREKRPAGGWKGGWEKVIGMNMLKIHYILVWKFHNETHYFTINIYNKKDDIVLSDKNKFYFLSDEGKAWQVTPHLTGILISFSWGHKFIFNSF